MKTLVVTSLFDIDRENKGDGRKISDYLEWFKKTLKLKVDMTIYTEEKFKEFVEVERKESENKTNVIIQKIDDIPFYKHNNTIKKIIYSDFFKEKMKDINRIECYLSEYNVIQYSKFGWLKDSTEKFEGYDFYFWMDAGCSRFFDDFDVNKKWPDEEKINKNKLTIQCNRNFITLFDSVNINDYIWESDCMLVGTLFGGDKNIIIKLENNINDCFNNIVDKNCINNEQISLVILAKQDIDFFDIIKPSCDGHLPLFKIIS